MEKPSEQKQEDSDVMFTSMEEELPLKLSDQESNVQSHKKYTEELLEESEMSIDDTESECVITECHKCHSSDINKMYIAGHDVLHCICNQCGKEWVE